MEVRYTKTAAKTLAGMDRKTKLRIREAVNGIPNGDIKPLYGTGELYRLRVGGWRVAFSYAGENVALIERIAPRGDVYKGGLL